MTGLEIAALALTAVGGITSAVGSFQAARGAAEGKEFEAEIAERDATIARRQASVDADDARRETRRRLATIRASYGSKGFSLAGSAIDVLEDQATTGELAAERETFAGELRALGFEDSAVVARTESKALRRSALPGLIGGLAGTAGRTARGGLELEVF